MNRAIPYLKMNGLSNDFVVLDGRKSPIALSKQQVQNIANRQNGIGCDQLIILEKPKNNKADIFMRIYNFDGGEVNACGNAARCIAALIAKELGKGEIIIETNAGLLPSSIDGEIVSVDMGVPLFDWQQIPLAEEFADTTGIELQVGPIDNPILHTPSVVNVGNPHAVFFVKDDIDNYNLDRFGPLLENHPIFPERANINLAQIIEPNHIKLRVWERGVGETKACGTGACATAICASRKDLTDREVIVDLIGGRLTIKWQQSDNHIIMSGAYSLDGKGIIPNNLLV